MLLLLLLVLFCLARWLVRLVATSELPTLAAALRVLARRRDCAKWSSSLNWPPTCERAKAERNCEAAAMAATVDCCSCWLCWLRPAATAALNCDADCGLSEPARAWLSGPFWAAGEAADVESAEWAPSEGEAEPDDCWLLLVVFGSALASEMAA